jgi:hypothetical protein
MKHRNTARKPSRTERKIIQYWRHDPENYQILARDKTAIIAQHKHSNTPKAFPLCGTERI